MKYQELRGAMMECDVALEHDPERVAEIGAALLSRYGGAEELAPEAVEMVRAQAAKRVGLRFSPTRIVTWDHRKLDGTY